jgi:hypothetical protein
VVHDHQAVGRADEEVNPPDNSLAIAQPRGDGIFGAETAAGPRGRDPRKQGLERNTEMGRPALFVSVSGRCRVGLSHK